MPVYSTTGGSRRPPESLSCPSKASFSDEVKIAGQRRQNELAVRLSVAHSPALQEVTRVGFENNFHRVQAGRDSARDGLIGDKAMPEKFNVRSAIEALLAVKLCSLDFPIKCGSDMMRLFQIIAHRNIDYISSQENLIIAFINALTVVIDDIGDLEDSLNIAILGAAMDLQSAAMESLDEINDELHLERIPQ